MSEKRLTQNEQVTLRTAIAVMLVALQRGKVPLGAMAQRLAKESWDIVRMPDDPPLMIEKKESRIAVPFGPHFE